MKRPAALQAWSLAAAAGIVLAAGLIVPGWAQATEYRSVGADPAILYDAPTMHGRKLAVAPRGMPVEVVVAQNDWVRVRDSSGELSWIERRALTDKRTLVTLDTVAVHASGDDSSPVTLRLAPGTLVDLVDAPGNGWLSIRHHDGETGWVKASQVWGN